MHVLCLLLNNLFLYSINNIEMLHFLHRHKSERTHRICSFHLPCRCGAGAEPACQPAGPGAPLHQGEISSSSEVPPPACAPASALRTPRGVRGHREDGGGVDLPPAAGSSQGCAGFRGASVVERGEDHAHRPGNGRRRRAWSPRLTVAGRLARCASARRARSPCWAHLGVQPAAPL